MQHAYSVYEPAQTKQLDGAYKQWWLISVAFLFALCHGMLSIRCIRLLLMVMQPFALDRAVAVFVWGIRILLRMAATLVFDRVVDLFLIC